MPAAGRDRGAALRAAGRHRHGRAPAKRNARNRSPPDPPPRQREVSDEIETVRRGVAAPRAPAASRPCRRCARRLQTRGKTTLFNALTGDDAAASSALFVTLDPLVRRVRLPDRRELLMSALRSAFIACPTRSSRRSAPRWKKWRKRRISPARDRRVGAGSRSPDRRRPQRAARSRRRARARDRCVQQVRPPRRRRTRAARRAASWRAERVRAHRREPRRRRRGDGDAPPDSTLTALVVFEFDRGRRGSRPRRRRCIASAVRRRRVRPPRHDRSRCSRRLLPRFQKRTPVRGVGPEAWPARLTRAHPRRVARRQ